MNKKLICTLMAGTLLVGTVTGCGSSSEGDSSAKGTELELFSSKAENKDILQKLVDKFNETHEDVTIKITAPADAGTVKGYLMVYDQIMAMTEGGPGTSTTSIAVLIYKKGFGGGQFAYQSANAVMLFVVVVLISVFQLRVLEKREEKLG